MKRLTKIFMLLAILFLTACESADVDLMKAALVKSGMEASRAECYATQMVEKGVEAGAYNYIAKLMNAGLSEKEAVNKARRKYGAEFKSAMTEAKKFCQ